MIFIYQIRKSLFTGSFRIIGTLKLCEIGMLLGIVNGIQFELFGMLFSWYNEYLILVLYNIFRKYLILFCTIYMLALDCFRRKGKLRLPLLAWWRYIFKSTQKLYYYMYQK